MLNNKIIDRSVLVFTANQKAGAMATQWTVLPEFKGESLLVPFKLQIVHVCSLNLIHIHSVKTSSFSQ